MYTSFKIKVAISNKFSYSCVAGIARRIDFDEEMIITLDGRQSHDPDCPGCDNLVYIWVCRNRHKETQSCFQNSSSLEFSNSSVTTINTTDLIPIAKSDAYEFILVIYRDSDVESRQTVTQLWFHEVGKTLV